MSDAYQPRPSNARRKVFVTRLYEVECSECQGVIDSRRSRGQAEESARRHRQQHRERAASR